MTEDFQAKKLKFVKGYFKQHPARIPSKINCIKKGKVAVSELELNLELDMLYVFLQMETANSMIESSSIMSHVLSDEKSALSNKRMPSELELKTFLSAVLWLSTSDGRAFMGNAYMEDNVKTEKEMILIKLDFLKKYFKQNPNVEPVNIQRIYFDSKTNIDELNLLHEFIRMETINETIGVPSSIVAYVLSDEEKEDPKMPSELELKTFYTAIQWLGTNVGYSSREVADNHI